MSQWTHVVGIMVIDDLRIGDDYKERFYAKLQSALGKPALYEDYIRLGKILDKQEKQGRRYKGIPAGREGTINYVVNETPEISHMNAWTVSINSDLRDYGSNEDVERVLKWFKRACDKLIIREAVIVIDVEGGVTSTYTYRNERFDKPLDKYETVIDRPVKLKKKGAK